MSRVFGRTKHSSKTYFLLGELVMCSPRFEVNDSSGQTPVFVSAEPKFSFVISRQVELVASRSWRNKICVYGLCVIIATVYWSIKARDAMNLVGSFSVHSATSDGTDWATLFVPDLTNTTASGRTSRTDWNHVF